MLTLGALSALLTAGAGGSAVFALSQTVRTGHALGQLSRAQRFHQDADMAHDSLRTDVAEAEQAGRGGSAADREQVIRNTGIHAGLLRRDLEVLRTLEVPPGVGPELEALRQPREAYVRLAEQHVRAALQGKDDPAADDRFQAAFSDLVVRQAALTTTLANRASGVEDEQADQERAIGSVVVLATALLLAGWAFLVTMLGREGRRLFQALGRETEQRTLAEQLRRALLPERLPDLPGLRLAARSRAADTATRVGGDWYDVICLPSGHVGLVVGDVVGHGLEAAAAMGQLRAALRVCAVNEPSPAAVLTRVNQVADQLQITDLATCLYAIVEPSTRTIRWSSAGHLNPLAIQATGSGHVLDGDPGPPIGVADDAIYTDRTCRLERQGTLMLYTDGLVERRTTSISDNLDRLNRIQDAPRNPEKLCDYVLKLIRADESDVQDDVTVLVLQAS